jgi:hypothetical protein
MRAVHIRQPLAARGRSNIPNQRTSWCCELFWASAFKCCGSFVIVGRDVRRILGEFGAFPFKSKS